VEFRDGDWRSFVVMADPVPAIHVFTRGTKDMDGRHTGGHDDMKWPTSNAASIPWAFHRDSRGTRPAIHVFAPSAKDVDRPPQDGHDDGEWPSSNVARIQ
jgi:hypothetical protein